MLVFEAFRLRAEIAAFRSIIPGNRTSRDRPACQSSLQQVALRVAMVHDAFNPDAVFCRFKQITMLRCGMLSYADSCGQHQAAVKHAMLRTGNGHLRTFPLVMTVLNSTCMITFVAQPKQTTIGSRFAAGVTASDDSCDCKTSE